MTAGKSSREIERLTAENSAHLRLEQFAELLRSGDVQLVEKLAKAASRDPSPEIRYMARRALAILKTETDDTASEKLSHDFSLPELLSSDVASRRSLGIKLAVIDGGREALERIKAAIRAEQSPRLLASEILALGKIGTESEIQFISEFLCHEDFRIRANAVEALALIGTDAAYRKIIPLLKDSDNRIKTNALIALKNLESVSLFEMLYRSALHDELFMRDSALHALDSFASPQALFVISRMALNDPVERLREKARAVLKNHASANNAEAVALLERIDAVEPPAGISAKEDLHPPSVSSKSIDDLLNDSNASHRHLGIIRLMSRDDDAAAQMAIALVRREQDPFILADAISYLNGRKIFGAFEHVAFHLNSNFCRVKANAIEALSSIDCEKAASILMPLLADPHHRVRANALIALSEIGKVNPCDYLKAMACDERIVFRKTALYVAYNLRRKEFLPIINMLIDDDSESVRDQAYKVLKEYASDDIPDAAESAGKVEKRINLSRNRDGFFENAFDRWWAELFADGGKSGQSQPSPAVMRSAFINLALKPEAISMCSSDANYELNLVNSELARIDELDEKLTGESMSHLEANHLKEAVEIMADLESLKCRRNKLQKLISRILYETGIEIASKSGQYTPEQRLMLQPELGIACAQKPVHVPPCAFSILPPADAGVTDVFDMTLRIYQKHVYDFSSAILKGLTIVAAVLSVEFFLGSILYSFAIGLGNSAKFIAQTIFLVVLTLQFLVISALYKSTIGLMLYQYVYDRKIPFRRILSKAAKLAGPLSVILARKYLFLAGWLLLAVVCTLPFQAIVELLERNYSFIPANMQHPTYALAFFSTSMCKIAMVLVAISVFAIGFFRYAFVEPIITMDGKRFSDPFAISVQVFSRDSAKIIRLYIFAAVMIALISNGTSGLLVFLIAIPGAKTALWYLSIISDICLTPILYSNLVIFWLMKRRERLVYRSETILKF